MMFTVVPQEHEPEYVGYRLPITNPRKLGARVAAENCEAVLVFPSGLSQRIAWVGSKPTETINVDSEKEIDLCAREASTGQFVCPTERGYFVLGPDDYVRLGRPPIDATLKVTCANGDPVQTLVTVREDSEGKVRVSVG
ncbi:MAG TPA: hypothetical protein VJ207_03735 [Thermoplasmata archaeon]|nr:hypothetical protein [Thermoplasmata archaeon]